MKTIKGPAIFLAQFAGDDAPYNTLDGMAGWAAGHGYEGIQIPSWDARLFNLKLAAESKSYCDEVLGTASRHGLAVTELSTHLQGQLVASHPAFDPLLDAFAPAELAGNAKAKQAWAVQQLNYAATASMNLALKAHATFSGALAWPFFYPWPQRPAGLIDEAFKELARLWVPILNVFDAAGVDVCYELHPGEDLHDGATFERFLDAVGGHKRANILYDPSHMVLQQLDYLAFLDLPRARARVSCQGCGVQSQWPGRRLRRLPRLDQSSRPLPLAGRWRDRFRGNLQQDDTVRLSRLGSRRVGVLHQESRRRRDRGL
jgi:sugar phosphate isomerase/epimerase